MKRIILIFPLVILMAFPLTAGTGALAAAPQEISYRIDLSRPDSGEIAVTLEMDAASGPLVLELPDSYGNGLAAGLSSHIVEERAQEESGRELPLRRDGDTWTIDYSGRITFTYKVEVSGYEAGTAYLDSLAASGAPWPYFPMLEPDLAYLPGYAVLARPGQLHDLAPSLLLELPPQWQQALPWTEQPASMDELLNNPIYAGELSIIGQGPLLLALPAGASAAAGGSLAEYAGKAQALLQESESLLGGLDLPEGQRLVMALLFRGEGDLLGDPYYPSSPFFGAVTIPAGSGNDPLSDATIEATARGMVSLLLSRSLEVENEAAWLSQGSAWYLQDLVPYEAGLWGANLFWDRFNGHYDTYQGARAVFAGSMAQAGTQGYESRDAAIVLTCGGAAACASFDAELRSIQPYSQDLPSLLRNLSDMSSADDPLTNDDILTTLVTLTGRDWSAFFRDYIEGVEEIPASSFSSMNIADPENSDLPASPPEGNASTSDWIILVVAALVVFIIPFLLEPYTMRPRKPGFLARELEKDEKD